MPALATPPGVKVADLDAAFRRKRKPHLIGNEEIEKLKQQVKTAEHDVAIHRRNHQNAEARIKELQAQLAEKDTLIESLQTTLAKASDTVKTTVQEAKAKGNGKGKKLSEAEALAQAAQAKAQAEAEQKQQQQQQQIQTQPDAPPVVTSPPTTTTPQDDEDEVADRPPQ